MASPPRIWLIAAALTLASASGRAMALTNSERDSASAACAQSHDTCLQSCNAAHGANNVLADVFRADCQNGCTTSYSQCMKSIDLSAPQPSFTPVPPSRLPGNSTNTLQPAGKP